MITPKDIETKMFKISLRGYNVTEVDDFLAEICDDYDKIYAENKELKKRIELLSQAVGDYKSMEGTLTDAVSIAGKSAADISRQANKSAAEIIRNAEITADSIIAGAEQKIAAESYRFESIKREVEIYKAKIIQLLNAQLSVLKGYPQSGSIESESDQQMWVKKTQDDLPKNVKAENKDTTENASEEKELRTAECDAETKRFFAADDIDNKELEDTLELELRTIKRCDTDELPRVSVNDDGDYVVDERDGK